MREDRDEIGKAIAHLPAVEDQVKGAELQQELAALQALRQGLAHRLLDDPGTGEADQGVGLGDVDIPEHGQAGGDATHGRVGHHRDEGQAALAQAQQVQQQLQEAQKKIAGSEVTGQAGGGLVTVTLSGGGKVTAVGIDRSVVDPDDVETLQDLVVGAFEDATREMVDLVKLHLGPLAQQRPQPAGPTES